MKRLIRCLVLCSLLAGLLLLPGVPTQAQGGVPVQIVCSLYLRAERSDESARLGLMNPGETHTALGRYGDWVIVQINPQLVGWSFVGSGCLNISGGFQALPVSETLPSIAPLSSGQPALQVLCTQYVRLQPNADAAQVALMYTTDAPWRVLERTADSAWLLVINADGGLGGWTSRSQCVNLLGDLNAIPVTQGDTAPQPAASVATFLCSQYVRAYPSSDGRRLAVLDATYGPVALLGRSQDAAWLLLLLYDGSQAWTSNSQCLSVSGNVVALPVIPPPAPPAPVPVLLPQAVPVSSPINTGVPSLSVLCTQYVRTRPDNAALDIAIMYPSDPGWFILGRDADANWLYVTNHNGGFLGWTARDTACLSVTGDLSLAPLVDTASAGAVYDGPPVVQLICTQNLRARPSEDSERLASMAQGEGPYDVLGRTQDTSWLLILRSDGTQGWTSFSECLGVRGNIFSAPVVETEVIQEGAPLAELTCTQYLRTAPSANASVVEILDGFDGPLSVTGRTEGSGWFQITLRDGRLGWAQRGACVTVATRLENIPVIAFASADAPPTAALLCSQYLRSGPDLNDAALRILDGSEGPLFITGRTADFDWVQLTLSSGESGWAAIGDCLSVGGDDLRAAPVIAFPTVTYDGPPVASLTCTQYIRRAPDLEAERITVLNVGEGLSILGRNEDASWLYVQRFDGLEGWVAYGACLNIFGNVLEAPVLELVTYQGPPVADVICNANLRRSPVADADILRVLGADSGYLDIVGRDSAGDWMLVEAPSGLAGWLSLGDCVVTLGDTTIAPVPFLSDQPELWAVVTVAGGACDGSDAASQVLRRYNRSAPISAATRTCAGSDEALDALTRFQVEVAIVGAGGCPGFQQVALGGGQALCTRAIHRSQVDDLFTFARGG